MPAAHICQSPGPYGRDCDLYAGHDGKHAAWLVPYEASVAWDCIGPCHVLPTQLADALEALGAFLFFLGDAATWAEAEGAS